jgi:AhpD family alkylhydroperoxidase
VLPAAVREVAVYRVAQRLGCSWCVDFGAMPQRLDGVDIERLAHIDDYAASPACGADERLAIAYADAMTDPRSASPTRSSQNSGSGSARRECWGTCAPG